MMLELLSTDRARSQSDRQTIADRLQNLQGAVAKVSTTRKCVKPKPPSNVNTTPPGRGFVKKFPVPRPRDA